MKLLKRAFFFVSVLITSTLVLCGCDIAGLQKAVSIKNDRVMYVGQKYTPVAEVKDGKAEDVIWSIDDEAVAKLENGQIVVLAEGSFNLFAKIGSATDVKHIYTHVANIYSITYELNGGTGDKLITEYSQGSSLIELVAPTKVGYEFAGFYAEPDFSGEAVEFVEGSLEQDLTLYAKWELVEYPIAYELNGGTCANLPESRSIESEEFVLPAPTKAGYDFAGWYTSSNFVGNQVTVLNSSNLEISQLFAKYATKAYTITYDLAGGECSTNPAYYTVEEAVVFAEPTKAGYRFTGWKQGEKVVTGIPEGSQGDITVVATWEIINYPISFELDGAVYVGLPTSRTIESEEFVLPTLTKAGFNFLGWYASSDFSGDAVTKLDASNLTITTLYAKFEIKLDAFIGEQGYPTIADALAAAKDGDVIRVKAGVFAEELTIDKAVTIEGPEKGVEGVDAIGDDRDLGEAEITKPLTVTANGVTIDGMKFSGEGYIVVSGNNFTLTNCIQVCTSYAKAGTSNRYGQVTNVGTISGLTITNSYFECNKNYCYGCIATSDIVSNVVIKGNFLQSTYATGSVNECIQLYTIDGTIEVSENTIMFDTTNFVIYMGSTGNSCTSVVIKDNHISGYNGNTAGISVRNMPAACKFDIIHNYIIGMSGNLIDSKTSKAGAQVNIKYNYFETAFKFTNVGEATVSYEGNSYFVAQTTATPDYHAYEEYDLEDLEEAYANSTLPTITYDLAGGQWGEVTGATKIPAGQTYVLPAPVKAGYVFAGWYEGETKVTECSGRSYNLVAHWEEAPQAAATIGEVGYDSLAAAFAAATEGDTIVLAAGEHSLDFVINKSIHIIGAGKDETIVNITVDIAGNLAAESIIFEDLALVGPGGAASTSGVGFQPSAALHIFQCINCHITSINTFFKGQVATTKPLEITIANSEIDTIGQFLIWVTAGSQTIKFNGNHVDAATCGAVSNPAAALLRIRSGSAYVYNNVFEGNTIAIDGLFECGTTAATLVDVQYNTFKGVTSFVHINGGRPVVFNNNLYLNAEGVAFTSVPASVSGDGVTADTNIFATEAERAAAYAEFIAPKVYTLTYDLDGGQWGEVEGLTELEQDVTYTLPTPVKTGYAFAGWFAGEEEVTTVMNKSYSLVAHWSKEYPATIGTQGYNTLADAFNAATEGATIVLAAGEHALDFVISKSVHIIGAGKDVTIVNMAKDIASNLAADTIIFENLSLVGTGGGPGISGVSFQSSASCHVFKCINCHITETNTFLKLQAATTLPFEITITNCDIDVIGQFLIWCTAGVQTITFTGNHVNAASCGGVENPAAALLRVRSGSAYIYNNVFEGNTQAIDGLFECGTGAGTLVDVQYNTFKGVTSFVHINDGRPVVFNNNLYLNAEGVALTSVPATVAGNGVTADTNIYATEAERAAGYLAFTSAAVYTVSYDLAGGQWGEKAGETSFLEDTPCELIAPVKAGYKFVGWFDGEEKVLTLQNKNYELVAHWVAEGLYVGTGEFAEYETIASALAAAKEGDVIRLYPGTYATAVTIGVKGVTLTSVDPENAAVITALITVAADEVTLENLEFTGAAGVTTTGFDRLSFLNNYVHNTTQNSAAWVETSVSTIGFVKLIGAQTNQVENCVISGNRFVNVLDSCIFAICPNGLMVDENEFIDYAYDGLRLDGGYSNGQIVVTNNTFEQSTKGAFTGIYMRAYSNYTSGDNKEILYVAGNLFKNIGYATSTSVFKGAITARNNQEHGVQFIIKHNDFESCYRYVRIRNQADDLNNFKSYKWSLIIENNNFYGLPADFYFNNRNASDNGSANPSLAVIGANYYTDDAKQKITVNPDMFMGVANTEFVSLDAPVVHGEIKNEVTYDIQYVAEGVTVDAARSAKIGSTVALPTLTKAENFFAGWYLTADFSGEAITSLENIKEDMVVYAKFVAYEYKTINYQLDGGALPEGAPTQFVVGIGATLPTPTKEGFNFLGWFNNAECAGAPITAIAESATADTTVYALWQDLSAKYDVTLNLNGGSVQYKSYQEVVADFLKDMNAVNGTTEFTGANFESKVRNPQFTAFLANDAMWAKWSWLFAYMQANDKNGSSVAIYEEVMTKRTCTDANWWFLTRDFSGFVNKKVGNFYYSVSPMDWTTYELAEGIWAAMPKVVTQEDIQALPTPVRPYYTFLGWFENADFSGSEVKVLYKDMTLYAKWEMTTVKLTYVLNNDNASLPQTEVQIHASQAFDLPTPTFPAKYYVFDGWFKDAQFTQPITNIAQYTTTGLTVYAKWTEISGYTINYVLNGGSIKYADRAAMLADFIADYNAVLNKSYALDGSDMPTGAWDEINFHTFYASTLANGVSVREKWLWLAEYLLQLSKRDLASNNCNVTGLTKLVGSATPAYSGDDTYGLSYAFRAFLAGSIVRPNSSYTSVDYTIYANAHGFWEKLSAAENGTYLNNKGTVTLPVAHLENYEFLGWYDNPELSGSPLTTLDGELDSYTLYAKFGEATPVTAVNFTNVPAELKRFQELQATWEVLPADANIKGVTFSSSNTNVITIDKQGYITAVGCGTATITIKSDSASGVTAQLQVVVYSPGHFNISYETESYTTVGGTIQLNAEYVNRDGSLANIVWEGLNDSIATVNEGIVTGVAVGTATIRAKVEGNESEYVDFVVTVLADELSAAISQVVDAHQSNAFTSYNLGIGAGTPAYYRDIIGSVSTLLYNQPLEINRKYEAAQAKQTDNHGGAMSSVEFITVHYTGNMSPKATAAANADYFSSGGGGTSIHYVTGNDGVFSSLDDTLIGFHAGDGTDTKFQWYPTGVMYKETDPERPVWGISTDSYFTINGQKTTRPVPEGDTAQTKKVTDARWINDMGLAWKVVEGQYYMGTTWWCYKQIAEGRICNHGGNLNSIGIESAVNPESDLWLTWQMTAQLVAKLMLDNNLDITRVVGHHFFSAKDCPQPLLENELEIWWEFIEMVKDNYNCITALKDYSMAMSFVGSNSAVDNNGRITMPEYATVITYKVTVTNPSGAKEEVTLATAVNGCYTK